MEPSRITAKAILASLLAIATATSLNGLVSISFAAPHSQPILMGLSVEEDSMGAADQQLAEISVSHF
jgi:hypothetical protein